MKNYDEVELAQSADFGEFCSYTQTHFLGEDAQIALVNRRDNELLLAYVRKFKISVAAQMLLAEQKNKLVLQAYLEHYPLCQEATAKLISLL